MTNNKQNTSQAAPPDTQGDTAGPETQEPLKLIPVPKGKETWKEKIKRHVQEGRTKVKKTLKRAGLTTAIVLPLLAGAGHGGGKVFQAGTRYVGGYSMAEKPKPALKKKAPVQKPAPEQKEWDENEGRLNRMYHYLRKKATGVTETSTKWVAKKIEDSETVKEIKKDYQEAKKSVKEIVDNAAYWMGFLIIILKMFKSVTRFTWRRLEAAEEGKEKEGALTENQKLAKQVNALFEQYNSGEKISRETLERLGNMVVSVMERANRL